MRRHLMASSARSKARKPSGQGSSPSGRLRLTILLATVAAFLLVPAAQAFANGTVFVGIEGAGSGEVSSVEGLGKFNPFFKGQYEGTPPIECSYESPGPVTGVCESEMGTGFSEVVEGVFLTALPAPGSEFAGWTIEEGEGSAFCGASKFCLASVPKGSEGTAVAIATFIKEGEGGKNQTLTVTKSGAGIGNVESSPAGIFCSSSCSSESAEFEEGATVTLTAKDTAGSEFREWSGACSGAGTCEVTMSEAKSVNVRFSHERPALTLVKEGGGTVKSKPKGISCAATCSVAAAKYYNGTSVVLTETAPSGVTFTEWTGACEGSGPTCTVSMTEARLVGAVFTAMLKLPANPQVLSLSKAAGTGKGTVKATGITCEADCTQTEAAYTGGVTEPKIKPAAVVILAETPAAGSSFAGWSGCDEEVEGKCKVTMSSAHSVTAQFNANPAETLTLNKSGGGTVKSKPKGVSCAATCSQAVASLSQGTTVVLTETVPTGVTFTEWTGACEGSGPTCTVSMTEAQTVGAVFTAMLKPPANPQVLTLTKAGTGTGIVKATGITCEAACSSTEAAYTGGVTEPKVKPAAVVTLVATSSVGSDAVVWSGCDSEPEGKCVVTMSEAKNVTARFEE